MYARTYVHSLRGRVFFLRMATPQRQKKDKEMLNPLPSLRSHPSAPDLTLEDGCGPAAHPVTVLDGAEAARLYADWLDSLGALYGWQVRDSGDNAVLSSFFFVYNRRQSL